MKSFIEMIVSVSPSVDTMILDRFRTWAQFINFNTTAKMIFKKENIVYISSSVNLLTNIVDIK